MASMTPVFDFVKWVFPAPIHEGHLVMEGFLFVVIMFLFLRGKRHKPPRIRLTEEEIDHLCEEWMPEPLVPRITKDMKHDPPVLDSFAGSHSIANGKEVVNFTAANYLGLTGNEKILSSCAKTLEKYGVGSCSSRGFSGTIDVHLDCEARITKFLGTTDTILYPYGLSTMISTIPAFCRKGDIIVVDEGVHWGIQNGLHLSRSKIFYFKHNDMESLQATLEDATRDQKQLMTVGRYIVVEAVYQNSGLIAPLVTIIKLKEEYNFRVILDESNSIGVFGASGRGLTEHFKIPIEKVDLLTAAMTHALATEGGFCAGSSRDIFHQRLNGSGYAFSASMPPYLATAAITAINILEENQEPVKKLKKNITNLRQGLSDVPGLEISSHPESPIVFLRLKNSTCFSKSDLQVLDIIADRVFKEHSVFISTSKRSTIDGCRLPAGIRLFVSAAHEEADLVKLCDAIKAVSTVVFSG